MNDLSAKELYASLLRQKAAIESLQMELMPLKEQLARLIKQSAPKDVRAVSYDPNKGGSMPTVEMALIARIARVTFQIGEREKDLLGLKDAYAVSLRVLRQLEKKLGDEDMTTTVFIKSFIEGKPNEIVRVELGVSVQTVSYHKTKIYNMLNIV